MSIKQFNEKLVYLLSHRFCGSWVWTRLSWYFLLGFHTSVIKMQARAAISSEAQVGRHWLCQQNFIPCGSITKGFRFLLSIQPHFLNLQRKLRRQLLSSKPGKDRENASRWVLKSYVCTKTAILHQFCSL
jgi:hypothetical protein